MNIEELKKIVRGNGFQESHGSTTMVIDVETVIDLLDELEAINFTGSSLELNHDFERGEDVWFIEKKIVEISDFCASPDRIEIIEEGRYKIVDIDQLSKVV